MTNGPGTIRVYAQLRALLRVAVLALLLVAAWLLWSGLYKPLLIGLGALSVTLTLYVVGRMNYFTNETYALRYPPRLLGFWSWIGGEIVKSSIDVARIVLAPKLRIEPCVVALDVQELDQVDQALLGNSITLTPGTLTLDVHDGRALVHCLTPASAAALESGEMQRRVAALRKR
jgi:multicomponent Na+:H+ antiporter subunit E